MAAGHIVNGQCVDVTASADLYFSTKPGSIASGLTSYEAIYTKVDGVWKLKSTSYSSTGVATPRYEAPAVIPTFGSCDTTQTFFDGMTLGWGVAAAVIAAWAIVHFKRALMR